MTDSTPFYGHMPIPGHAPLKTNTTAELSPLETALGRTDAASQALVQQSEQRLSALIQHIRHAQSQGVVREKFEVLQAMLDACLAAQEILNKPARSQQSRNLSSGLHL